MNEKTSNKVLILEGEKPAAYALMRNCSLNNFECYASSEYYLNIARFSRYCNKIYKSPPITDEANFIDWLIDLLKKNNFITIMTFSDQSTKIISDYKFELSQFTHIYQPDPDTLKYVLDKNLTYKLATDFKIAVPKIFPYEANEAPEKIAKKLEFPVVLKPNSKYERKANKIYFHKIGSNNYAWSENDFIKKFTRIKSLTQNFTIQQYIKGVGRGFFTCIYSNKYLGFYAHERIREFPVTGGASSYRRSIDYEEFIPLTEKIIGHLKWTGPIMFEFKYDCLNNKYYLIEINGRWWGSLPLAINNGVEFPKYLLYSIKNKNNFSINFNYKKNFTSRLTFPHDILWFLQNLFKLNIKKAFSFFHKSDSEDIFDKKDILSYIIYIISQIFVIFKMKKIMNFKKFLKL